MAIGPLSPDWFFGWDVVLELSFAIITMIVAFFALQVFRSTSQRQVKLLGISFLFFSASYFIQSVFNFLVFSEANEMVCSALNINSIAMFNLLGIYTHILFMTLGLVILVYMTFKTDKKRILWLLISTSILAILLSQNTLYLYFLFASIYLLFISWHFILNYFENKQKKTLLTATAFLFLLFGNIHFIFSVNHQLFYVIGHFLELVAYILILANLFLVLRR